MSHRHGVLCNHPRYQKRGDGQLIQDQFHIKLKIKRSGFFHLSEACGQRIAFFPVFSFQLFYDTQKIWIQAPILSFLIQATRANCLF